MVRSFGPMASRFSNQPPGADMANDYGPSNDDLVRFSQKILFLPGIRPASRSSRSPSATTTFIHLVIGLRPLSRTASGDVRLVDARPSAGTREQKKLNRRRGFHDEKQRSVFSRLFC